MLFFLKNGCPLCGEYHELEFFIFVERHIITDIEAAPKIIKVIRYLCINNYKKRLETNELLQYTITILPGFLISYGRIPVNKILDAFSGYIKGEIRTYYAAAIACGVSSRHSFRLYYIRILKRLTSWCGQLQIRNCQTEMTDSTPDAGPCEEIEQQWELTAGELKKQATREKVMHWQGRGHSWFCIKKMGLGP